MTDMLVMVTEAGELTAFPEPHAAALQMDLIVKLTLSCTFMVKNMVEERENRKN